MTEWLATSPVAMTDCSLAWSWHSWVLSKPLCESWVKLWWRTVSQAPSQVRTREGKVFAWSHTADGRPESLRPPELGQILTRAALSLPGSLQLWTGIGASAVPPGLSCLVFLVGNLYFPHPVPWTSERGIRYHMTWAWPIKGTLWFRTNEIWFQDC